MEGIFIYQYTLSSNALTIHTFTNEMEFIKWLREFSMPINEGRWKVKTINANEIGSAPAIYFKSANLFVPYLVIECGDTVLASNKENLPLTYQDYKESESKTATNTPQKTPLIF